MLGGTRGNFLLGRCSYWRSFPVVPEPIRTYVRTSHHRHEIHGNCNERQSSRYTDTCWDRTVLLLEERLCFICAARNLHFGRGPSGLSVLKPIFGLFLSVYGFVELLVRFTFIIRRCLVSDYPPHFRASPRFRLTQIFGLPSFSSRELSCILQSGRRRQYACV